MKTRNKSYRLVRRAGEQGTRPSGRDQPEVEKLVTRSNSSQDQGQRGHQEGPDPNPGPVGSPPKNCKKEKRKKWTREEYKEVLYCFYLAFERPQTNNTEDTYVIWCERNGESDKFDTLDANKLANIRRYILRIKKITDIEISEIKEQVKKDVGNVIRTDANRNQEYGDGVENHDEPDALDRGIEDGEEDLGANNAELHENRETGENLENEVDQEKIILMKDDILEELSAVQHTKMDERDPLQKIRQTHKFKNIFKIANEALKQIIVDLQPDLSTLNQLTYATAKTVQAKCGVKSKKRKGQNTIATKPKWERKIEKEVESYRKEISVLDEMEKNEKLKSGRARKVLRKHGIIRRDQIKVVKEQLKQKLQMKAQRLRRFTKRNKFYRQNNLFETDAKKFYRDIGKNKIDVVNIPTEESVRDFWESIWGNEVGHNTNAEWLKSFENATNNVHEQEWQNISVEEIKEGLKKSQKWKSPGIDKVPNFWLDSLSSMHSQLATCFNRLILNPESTPEWFCMGTTYLLPKTEDTANPKNYRPITCLTTSYKLLTSILSERTYSHLEEFELFPLEQKGCRKGSYGCKDQLLVNKMILEHAKTKQKNLHTSWIDYKKAFDSVPHTWILKCLEIFKISPMVTNFLRSSMNLWKTNLILSHSNGTLSSRDLRIKRGIFQGDSLSPLLFCMALMPLSQLLNDTGYGYKIHKQKINHLFYMDDLKLYATNAGELEGLLKTVKAFSDDIGMEFGLDKCAKASFNRGKLVKTENLVIDEDTIIKELDQESTYKYLGVNEGDGVQHAKMKEKIRRECIRRVRLIMKTELNSKNRITAVNTLAIPVVTYSFSIINWNMSDLRKIDTKIRKQLTCNRMHHPKSDVDRLYIQRKSGGRGMIQLELSYKTSVIGLRQYLDTTNDWMLQLVNRHEHSKKLHSILKESDHFSQELNVNTETDNLLTPTENARKTKKMAKNAGLKQLESRWQDKPLHGQFATRANNADVDKSATHQWLSSSGLKGETEGFILAAQDQSLFTRNFQANILHNGADPSCRFCDDKIETIDHLVSGCPILAPGEYTNRHNRVGQYLHWKICQHFNIETKTPNWYEHHPDPVTEGDKCTILWDFPIHTDRTIQANRPDIVVKDKQNNTCLLIDMSIPSDRNVSAKVFEKLSKYKDLEIEIQKMWHLKTTTVPVVVGALGIIKKGTQQFLDKIPGNPSLSEIQKIVLNSTAHILRRTLSI